ncbi:MAG: TIGR03759 family integrating conjugative element protein [Gammaproteobacteria bacterium HGW-Gammaproteobacteria-10]|nr:MAG: TIGR03759 family integrating conjugative element protein [Gammaproteobacteria bacterium HGW-Gammaproteobacteria-10]
MVMPNKSVVGVVVSIVALMTLPIIPSVAEQTTSEYRDTQIRPVETDDVQRKQWSLSAQEWRRYKTLMKGIRGSISPATISPIEVLGTHARNDQERKKYAEMWAQMRFEDAERILAFQAAYNEAFRKLYGDVQLIDINKIRPHNSTQTMSSITADSRLLVFLKVDKCYECKQLIRRVLGNRSLNKNQIDVYFVDTKPGQDDEKIKKWVTDLAIDPTRLKSGKITLNHDQGNLLKIMHKVDQAVPVAFTMDAHSLTVINL